MNAQQRQEILQGIRQGALVTGAALVLALPVLWWHLQSRPAAESGATVATPAEVRATPAAVDFAGSPAPDDVQAVSAWAVASADARSQPFAVIDKRRTHVYVFGADGRLRGHSPALLGYAPGDDTVPGIGQRPIEQVKPHERTTPAGRFVAASGRNLLQEDVIWVDYGAAVSMHRVRLTDPRERRLERLASATSDDNRISYGCINLPADFFEQVVWPTLGKRSAVVYVLPEVKPLHTVFPAAAARHAARGGNVTASM